MEPGKTGLRRNCRLFANGCRAAVARRAKPREHRQLSYMKAGKQLSCQNGSAASLCKHYVPLWARLEQQDA